MDLQQCMQLMTNNAKRIRMLGQGVSDQQARWKPDAASWSILEVINHLYDEERAAFRVRPDIILDRPDQAWLPLDPQSWVAERSYFLAPNHIITGHIVPNRIAIFFRSTIFIKTCNDKACLR